MKRLASEIPLPKPEIVPPRPLRPRPPEPITKAERLDQDESPPPTRRREVAAAVLPEPKVEIAQRAQDESTASAGDDIAPPAARYNPKPPFPAAYRNVIDASMELLLTIGADGRARGYHVLETSGSSEVDREQAAFILEHWEFVPASRGGRSVESSCPVKINFVRR